MAGKSFVVPCPCCQAKLTIDAELGAVIAHEEPPRQRSTADLGTAIDQLASKSREREERFRQQMAAEADKSKVLDRKFQEGLKKAKDDPGKPLNPMELD